MALTAYQVLLRKREFKPQPQPSQSQSQQQPPPPQLLSGKGKGKLETRDPKDLEQLVQQVMRELPRMGVKGNTEKENAALAKLDGVFDRDGDRDREDGQGHS